MRKVFLAVFILLTCAITPVCSAFEIDRTQWTNFANVNNIECFYNERSIQKSGNTAKVWLCYHYKELDNYILMCKEYTQGSRETKIIKKLEYFSDGTLKRASSKEVPNAGLGTNEDIILQKLW